MGPSASAHAANLVKVDSYSVVAYKMAIDCVGHSTPSDFCRSKTSLSVPRVGRFSRWPARSGGGRAGKKKQQALLPVVVYSFARADSYTRPLRDYARAFGPPRTCVLIFIYSPPPLSSGVAEENRGSQLLQRSFSKSSVPDLGQRWGNRRSWLAIPRDRLDAFFSTRIAANFAFDVMMLRVDESWRTPPYSSEASQ
jgi:hypothetical protein